MDESPTRWSFRDIFLSLGIAADPAILALSFLGLSAGSVAYGFFYFLGSATGEPTALSIFAILGGIVFIVLWILTSGILARMVVVRLLEGRQRSNSLIAFSPSENSLGLQVSPPTSTR